MKRYLFALLFTGLLLPVALMSSDVPTRPEELAKPEEPTFVPPVPIRKTLSNGVRLIMLQDHRVPMIEIKVVALAGGVYEPPGKAGLAALVADCLITGGSESLSPETVSTTLESLGAEFTRTVRREETILTLDLLSRDWDRGLTILAQVVRSPGFHERSLETARRSLLGSVQQAIEDPAVLGRAELKKLLYGPDSPWASYSSPESLSSLTRDDLLAFHRRTYNPTNVILAVSGDFDPEVFLRRAGELFGDWKDSDEGLPTLPDAPEEIPSGLYVIDRPELSQVTFLMGDLIGPRLVEGAFNEDRYPLELMDFYLGGSSFSSLLMKEIRSKRGLAYATYSENKLYAVRGWLLTFCQTSPETTGEAMGVMREVLDRTVKQAIPEEELGQAQTSLINGFLFNYEYADAQVQLAAEYELKGLPEDFLARYSGEVRRQTPETIRRVAAQHLDPEGMVILVIGPREKIEEQLKPFGPIREWKVSE